MDLMAVSRPELGIELRVAASVVGLAAGRCAVVVSVIGLAAGGWVVVSVTGTAAGVCAVVAFGIGADWLSVWA
ncbi:MAG: hypothetical protein KGJ99_13880 [Betaproteobacteria bacterium]|nr:hypothetical protein [Betaproteobacteria bacterium]